MDLPGLFDFFEKEKWIDAARAKRATRTTQVDPRTITGLRKYFIEEVTFNTTETKLPVCRGMARPKETK